MILPAGRLSGSQISQYAHSIQVLLSSLYPLPIDRNQGDIHIKVDPSQGVHQVDQRLKVHPVVVRHGHASQPHFRRFAGELQPRLGIRHAAAHVENSVELIEAVIAGNVGEGIPGDGDQADLLGVEIDRHDHVGVRMGHGPAGGAAVLKGVDTEQSDVHDASKGLFLERA